jgi:hypothetical protein
MTVKQLPWAWWDRGQSEDAFYGFLTREERDRHGAGGPGPFKRVLRPLDAPPPDLEARVLNAFLGGYLADFVAKELDR